MKALSLWQPWASAIFATSPTGSPIKPDETRGWSTHVRGRIAIHAAKRRTEAGRDYDPWLDVLVRQFCQDGVFHLPHGALIGTVELVEVRPAEQVALERTASQLAWGDYRKFGDDGKRRYALVLRNPVALVAPVPWLGRQGFFCVPDEILLPWRLA